MGIISVNPGITEPPIFGDFLPFVGQRSVFRISSCGRATEQLEVEVSLEIAQFNRSQLEQIVQDPVNNGR